MKSSTDSPQYRQSPEHALAATVSHDGPLLLDVDETLYRRNSTEDFIDTARPAVLAWLLLKILEVLAPWRFTGGHATRDAWRVSLVGVCMPWTWWLWHRRVARMPASNFNQDLLEAVHKRPDDGSDLIRVVSLGFYPVIRPLVLRMGFTRSQIIAFECWQFTERAQGKLARVLKKLNLSQVKQSSLITDSMDDADLLDFCAHPMLVEWPESNYVAAFSNRYIPGQYTTRIKRPGQQYIWRGVIREDLIFWLLCSLPFLAKNPLPHVAGLGLLLFSFWTIYEWGYADNDRMGELRETKPNLSSAYFKENIRVSLGDASLWAVVSGAMGIGIVFGLTAFAAWLLAAWIGVLVATVATYWFYNRMKTGNRVWLYGILRALRIGALAAVFPISIAGWIAMAAYTVSRWIPYWRFRRVQQSIWRDDFMHTTFVVLFVIGSIAMTAMQSWSAVITVPWMLLLFWNLYKTRREFRVVGVPAGQINGLRS